MNQIMKSIKNLYLLNIFGDVLFTIQKKILNLKIGAKEILKTKSLTVLKIK